MGLTRTYPLATAISDQIISVIACTVFEGRKSAFCRRCHPSQSGLKPWQEMSSLSNRMKLDLKQEIRCVELGVCPIQVFHF